MWLHVEEHELCPGTDSIDSWLDGPWLTFRVRGRMLPVFPTWGNRNALTMHDVHHMLTGYDTSLGGEARLAAWELASGGCGWNLFFWIDRLSLLTVALILMPRLAVKAWRRGMGQRNLFTCRRDEILKMEFEALQKRVGMKSVRPDPSGPGS